MFSTVVYLVNDHHFCLHIPMLIGPATKRQKMTLRKKDEEEQNDDSRRQHRFPNTYFSATPLFWSSPLFFLSSTSLVLSLSPFFRKTQAGYLVGAASLSRAPKNRHFTPSTAFFPTFFLSTAEEEDFPSQNTQLCPKHGR